jgi:hypothetical protein
MATTGEYITDPEQIRTILDVAESFVGEHALLVNGPALKGTTKLVWMFGKAV